MLIHFWGVRGSIATPGASTSGVGGNTSCVEVTCGETRFVLDAGTGLRGLGSSLLAAGGPVRATLLLSHYHWDHIQGLPFFVPVYMKSTELTIIGAQNGVMSVREALAHQMSAPVFPVHIDETAARIATREVSPGDTFDVGEAKVTVARGHHPGDVVAYRIDHNGQSIVYATDTEHYACIDPALRALAEGCDVLVYDAQYLPEEYPSKLGWGHSTYAHGAELARASGAKKLVLFHHDPSRDDAAVESVEARARALFPNTVAAREGMTLHAGTAAGGEDRTSAILAKSEVPFVAGRAAR